MPEKANYSLPMICKDWAGKCSLLEKLVEGPGYTACGGIFSPETCAVLNKTLMASFVRKQQFREQVQIDLPVRVILEISKTSQWPSRN